MNLRHSTVAADLRVETFPGSGIPESHPRYLPMSTKDECREKAPGRTPYECSRFPDHGDEDHAAHGSNMRMFARWPRRTA